MICLLLVSVTSQTVLCGRLIWNKPYLDILSGTVIRGWSGVHPNKKEKQKAKALCRLFSFERSAGSRHIPARDIFAFAYGSGISPCDDTMR